MINIPRNLIFAKAAAAKENLYSAKSNPSYPFLPEIFKQRITQEEEKLAERMQISQENLRSSLARYSTLTYQIPKNSNLTEKYDSSKTLDFHEQQLLLRFIETEKILRFLTKKINNAIYDLDSQEAIRWAKEHPKYPIAENPIITPEIANIFNRELE